MKKNNIINRILIGSCAIACVTVISGCTVEQSPYTQEEIDRIGEYSALLIAGNNPDSSRLVDVEDEFAEDEIPDSETEEETDIQEPDTDSDDTDEAEDNHSSDNDPDIEIVDVSVDNNEDVYQPTLEEFFGFESGLTVTYKGYEWRDSLTNQSGSYYYDPEEGNYFLILSYTIFNGTGATQDVDFLYAGYSFNLKINNEKTIIAHEIPINEDMPTYIGRLADGTGVNLMITFECDSSYVNNIESLQLTVKNTDQTSSFTLE